MSYGQRVVMNTITGEKTYFSCEEYAEEFVKSLGLTVGAYGSTCGTFRIIACRTKKFVK